MKTNLNRAFTLIEIMIVVAIIGILAAVALPNLREAITRSRERACSLNRKNIDAAKLRWAIDNREPETVTPPDEQLFGANHYIEHKPDCPAKGNYALNAVHEKCTCSATGHENRLLE